MSLILPNSVFLHIPKTGGQWVRYVTAQCGLKGPIIRSRTGRESTEGTAKSWHCVPLWDKRYRERRFKFCFVRHPIQWYRSYWSFRVDQNNWQKNDFDDRCKNSNFQIFIDNVIRHYPDGYLSWLYAYYVEHCQFVGKIEYLADDLIFALNYAGESFEEAIIYKHQDTRKNVTKNKEKAIYGLGQEDAIREIEKEVLDRYGYVTMERK